jgi:hypothetical protein
VEQKISQNLAIIAALAVNLMATVYASYTPGMGDKLFVIYTATTGALYGLSQQKNGNSDDREGK